MSLTQDIGLLFLRASIGLFMLFGHGWGKLVGFSEKAAFFPDPIGVGKSVSLGLAVFSEVFCSVLLILGIYTRIAAIPLLCTMLVAAFVIHANDPWGKVEFALLYAIPYLTLVFTGGGNLSVDAVVAARKNRRSLF